MTQHVTWTSKVKCLNQGQVFESMSNIWIKVKWKSRSKLLLHITWRTFCLSMNKICLSRNG